MQILKRYLTLAFTFLIASCQFEGESNNYQTLFEDSFGNDSQGEYQKNIIQLPPPEGLGYTYKVLEGGHLPTKWILADELSPTDPKKGFWVIPADSGYLEQGGRSHNSVLFANTPIPPEAKGFTIKFKQYRGDNDPITYVLGATEPAWDQGFELGYMSQVPGTDSTTNNAYIIGALGETMVEDMAYNHEWADHMIRAENDTLAWYVNDQLLIKKYADRPMDGYFGIRHRYERGTRYDDVVVMIDK